MTDHQEILDRIDILEDKVDRLLAMVDHANGAWLLIKWAGAAAVGIAAIWAAIKSVK